MVYKILLVSLVALFGTTSFALTVDTEKSKVTWTGSKVVGSKHFGNVNIKEADLTWAKGDLTKGKVVIDMTSITNTDIKSKGNNKKLVGHLKSDDFFSVKKHETAVLDIQKVKKDSGKSYTLTGDLIIKGETAPVTVKANVVESKKGFKKVEATFNFDRTKYGVKYGSGKFFTNLGDKVISDEVGVKVELVLVDKKS